MFKTLRSASEALQELRHGVEAIAEALRDISKEGNKGDALSDRVAALEIGGAKRAAEAEATLLKADALFKNARNSEERARTLTKKANGASGYPVEGEAEIRKAYAELYGVSEADLEGAIAVEGHITPSTHPDSAADPEASRKDPSRALRLRAKFR